MMLSHTSAEISHLLKVMSTYASIAISRWSGIKKSNTCDEIKREFSQDVLESVWLHYFDFNKAFGEKVRWELHNDFAYHSE